jgi:hypothetical protein
MLTCHQSIPDPCYLVLVVVFLVGRVPVPVMHIIDVVAVAHGVVAAAGFMRVAVAGMGDMRKRVLVVVALVRRMRVTIVYIVGMSVMLDASVAATRTVLVRVFCVHGVRIGSHRSPVVVPTSLSREDSAQALGLADGSSR